mmetsp:Transcript_21932/g.46504  ORF Transcript_21932/g.46504 Transcript_21932/m.46504 type:complete len:767 (-) Transcript_21932:4132-6432(-)
MDFVFLEEELKSAESFLATLKEKQQKQQQRENEADGWDADLADTQDPPSSVLERLLALQITTDSLDLSQDYLSFLESTRGLLDVNCDDRSNSDDTDFDALLAHAQLCDELAHQVIMKHAGNILDVCPALYEKAYLPSFEYVHEYLVTLLRQELQSSRYPTAKGCRKLLESKNGTDHLGTICRRLIRLESTHDQILQIVEGVDAAKHNNSVLLELFHPLLDRVYFHFINTTRNSDGGDGDPNNSNHESRLTTTRIDRLPEWLLSYINNNFLQEYGPYEVVVSVMGPESASQFCEELIRLIQWVLVEQRNFFDDPIIVGPKSNPQILYQAIEQFLEFDSALIELLADTTASTNNNNNTTPLDQSASNFSAASFTGLMDVLVASNDDLFDWWIQRERESVFSTLFSEEDDDNGTPKTPLASHISPRAELFCALIRSVQLKASTLIAPGKYLREVAVPLCSQFVNALHETLVDLRDRLIQKRNRQQHLPPATGIIDSEKQRLVSNINEWIEIINGTQLASQILLSKERAVSSQSDHDLGRFGRSLERLVEVMMDEFAGAFVETTLMEHAKFANYLMLASHLLASPEYGEEGEMWKNDLTVELEDTKIVLQYFQEICDSILHPQKHLDEAKGIEEEHLVSFGPSGMRVRVANRLVDKLLEVALDTNQVTPDIWLKGATKFAHDVQILLGSYSDIPAVNHLLDVTKFMILDYDSFCGLFAAIGGLMGSDAFLDIEELNADTTLHKEAESMLKAKNVNCPLAYAVSILNRRRS